MFRLVDIFLSGLLIRMKNFVKRIVIMLDLHINGFVPVDNVAGQNKRLNVDDVDVSFLRAEIQPLALQR